MFISGCFSSSAAYCIFAFVIYSPGVIPSCFLKIRTSLQSPEASEHLSRSHVLQVPSFPYLPDIFFHIPDTGSLYFFLPEFPLLLIKHPSAHSQSIMSICSFFKIFFAIRALVAVNTCSKGSHSVSSNSGTDFFNSNFF